MRRMGAASLHGETERRLNLWPLRLLLHFNCVVRHDVKIDLRKNIFCLKDGGLNLPVRSLKKE